MRRRLAGWAAQFVGPQAFVVDDTGFPQDGASSPRVARMYCGALGKTGNCRIRDSVHAATDWASAALAGGCSCRSPGTAERLGYEIRGLVGPTGALEVRGSDRDGKDTEWATLSSGTARRHRCGARAP
jgi:hypothetical protein